MVDASWILARIEATKEMIVSYEEAIMALTIDGVQSFSLDTGQTKKVVTRADLGSIKLAMSEAYTRLFNLEARLYGGTVTAVPQW